MKIKTLVSALAFSALLALPLMPRADDIDLYTGGEQVTGASTNVLIYLDNSANWSNASGWTTTQGEAELDALKAVLDTLSDSVRVGVMMHTRTGDTSGAYVRFAVRRMTAENKARLKEVLDDIKSTAPNAPQDKVAQSADGDHAIEEVFRYFNGLGLGFTDARDTKEDYGNGNGVSANTNYYQTGGSVSAALEAKAHPAAAGGLSRPAYSTSASTTYTSPSRASEGCAKNYLIWIGNTKLDGSTSGTRLTSAAALVSATADTTQIPAIASGNDAAASTGVMMDEWARFMYKQGVVANLDQVVAGSQTKNPIVTYTVDVFPKAGTADPVRCTQETAGGAQQVGQHFVMQSTANAGGGKCFPATNTSQLKQALQLIFAEIQAINSVFASATLPVSVNTQGTYENQVYIGVFRPDQYSRPRWFGNLKEYQFARYCDNNNNDKVDDVGGAGDERIDGNTNANAPTTSSCAGDKLKLFLADRNNLPAIDQSNTTGFIDLSATSFWTQSSNFWNFYQVSPAGASDAPDGPNVERGGEAFRLRTLYPVKTATLGTADIDHRKVYTCMGNCLSPTGTAADKTLSNNPFVDSNTAVTTRLTPPAAQTVTLSRAANAGTQTYTVTAACSVACGFNNGTAVTISGASPTAYNGTYTITTAGPASTTFTYTVTETPTDDTSGAALASWGSTPKAISGISVSGGTAVYTVTGHGYSSGDSVTIAGAPVNFSFLNFGTFTPIGAATANTFTLPVTLPTPAATSGSNHGTSSAGTVSNFPNSGIYRSGTNPARVIVTLKLTGSQTMDTNSFRAGAVVTIAGATPTAYNGNWKIENVAGACESTVTASQFCFRLDQDPTQLPGVTMRSTKQGTTTSTVSLTRSLGSQIVFAEVPSGVTHSLSVGQMVSISNSRPEYVNGGAQWPVLTIPNNRTFTFGPVTLTPSADPIPTGAQASLSASGAAVAPSSLINWMRGVDNNEDENQNASLSDVRAGIHGDVLHSRPLLINYGGSLGIVGFYGSNDGYLHAFKGGTADTDGVEKWAFVPDEFVDYSRLSRLYRNSNLIRYPNTQCSVTPTPTARDYFWDGYLSVYQSPDGTPTTPPTKTYIYAAMRRGGKNIYALDVTNPDTPKFLWRIQGGSGDYAQLGQTWSEPHVTKLKGTTSAGVVEHKDVLIFGGGYDPTDDDQKPGCLRGDRASQPVSGCFAGAYAGIGRGVFVADAMTGARIQFLAPWGSIRKYSFAADVSTIDLDGDGYIDRIYAVDSGGQLFRFDANQALPIDDANYWSKNLAAKLGDLGNDGGADARKFLFAPELVPFAYSGNVAMNILLGSGDREKPLPNSGSPSLTCSSYYPDAYFGSVVTDQFYSVIDTAVSGAATDSVATVNRGCGSDPTTKDLLEVNANPNALTSFSLSSTWKGWCVTLKQSAEEKLVNTPRVVSGMALFGTNAPMAPEIDKGICTNLGNAYGYALNPFTGLPTFNRDGSLDSTTGAATLTQADYAAKFAGGGLPPTVTAGVVGIGGSFYRFLIGGTGTGLIASSPIAGAKNPITLKGTRSRVYWYYPVDEK